jgi:hypothetical protein
MATLLEAFQSLGFPIACVFDLGVFVYKMWEKAETHLEEEVKNMREDSQNREKILYEEISKFNDILNKFNTTLNKIDSRVGNIETKLDIKRKQNSEEEGD